MCGSRVSIDVVVEILKGILDLYLSKIDNKPVNETDSVDKTKIIDNLTELRRAMSDVSSSETHTVVDYISSTVLNASVVVRQYIDDRE